MDKRIKLEKYILNEFQAKDSQTFLYQLHENSYFDKEKFSILLNICDSLAKSYGEFGKTDNYNEVLKSLFVIFEHTLFYYLLILLNMISLQLVIMVKISKPEMYQNIIRKLGK
jgi:hypothetical protein